LLHQYLSIGSYSYKKWGGKCKVEVFNMKVEEIFDTWEEDFRERKWINIDEAKEFINSKKIIQIVSLFNEKINGPNN
jgi:phosphohistidine phosphatase